MAAGVPAEQVVSAAVQRFGRSENNNNLKEKLVQKCVESLSSIPGMGWCPLTLLDVSQLDNYYRQISLEKVMQNSDYDFPNAIYLNGLDAKGSIRTGKSTFYGVDYDDNSTADGIKYSREGYSYIPSIILYNVKEACKSMSSKSCEEISFPYEELRQKSPLNLWNDPNYGRLTNWP